jgi:hypothetical protein
MGGEIEDLLLNFEDLITWLASAKLFSRGNLMGALEKWRGKLAAERVFNEAVTLRNCLSEMASEIVHARSVPRAAVQVLNKVIGKP